MNKQLAIVMLLALLVIALTGSGAAGYIFLSNQVELSNVRTQSAQADAAALEKQLVELSETAQLAEERGREIAMLRDRTAELEKQVAGLKAAPANPNLRWTFGEKQAPEVKPLPANAPVAPLTWARGEPGTAQEADVIRGGYRVNRRALGGLEGATEPLVQKTAPVLKEDGALTRPAQRSRTRRTAELEKTNENLDVLIDETIPAAVPGNVRIETEVIRLTRPERVQKDLKVMIDPIQTAPQPSRKTHPTTEQF